MKRIVFLTLIFALAAVNDQLNQQFVAVHVEKAAVFRADLGDTENPLGEGEENSSEEKDISEDDDDAGLGHRLHSRELSANSDLHILYQEILFRSIEKEVVIQPPRG